MIGFDFAVIDKFDKNTKRLYFKSTTSEVMYYFEFTWKYIKNIFNIKWHILCFPFMRKHIKGL